MHRREYTIDITINDRRISKVIIDPHYEAKHSDSVDDEIIVALVRLLDRGQFDPDDANGEFEYFVSEGLELDGKVYRLVWLLESDQVYVGVVNAFRRK